MNIKVNDNVLVLTGKYKGKQGKVLATFPKKGTVVVEGVAIVHKHEKARKANETSRIVTEESPIDASNVMVVCEKCGKPTRVGYKFIDGKKVRVCKKDGCGAVLDKAYVKKSKAKVEEEKTEAPKKRTRKRSAKVETKTETVESTSAVTGEE